MVKVCTICSTIYETSHISIKCSNDNCEERNLIILEDEIAAIYKSIKESGVSINLESNTNNGTCCFNFNEYHGTLTGLNFHSLKQLIKKLNINDLIEVRTNNGGEKIVCSYNPKRYLNHDPNNADEEREEAKQDFIVFMVNLAELLSTADPTAYQQAKPINGYAISTKL